MGQRLGYNERLAHPARTGEPVLTEQSGRHPDLLSCSFSGDGHLFCKWLTLKNCNVPCAIQWSILYIISCYIMLYHWYIQQSSYISHMRILKCIHPAFPSSTETAFLSRISKMRVFLAPKKRAATGWTSLGLGQWMLQHLKLWRNSSESFGYHENLI